MSAVTKVGTGIYQFTFATPLPNKFYTVSATATEFNNEANPLIMGPYDFQTTGFKIRMKKANGDAANTGLASVIVFGSDEVYTEPPPAYDWETDPTPPGGGVIP